MSDDTPQFDRRSILRKTGAGLALATGTAGLTGLAQADTPDEPQNLQATDRTDTAVELEWDEPDRDDRVRTEIEVYEYTCGYKGCYTGDFVKSVVEWGTRARIGNLEPSETYVFRAYTIDQDEDKSDSYASVQYGTDSTWYDVHSPSSWEDDDNELGGQWSAQGFRNGDGDVSSDGLYLKYDEDGGIFETYVADPNGSGAWTIDDHEGKSIKFLVSGDKGDEEEDAYLTWGTEENGPWGYYAVGQSIDTDSTVLTIPLDYAASYYGSWSVDMPETFKLNFGREDARKSGLTIERVWVSEYE